MEKEHRAKASVATGILAVAVFLAGCGGSSHPSTSSYLKQANAICGTYEAKVNALPKPTSAATVAQLKQYLSSAVTLLHEEDKKLTGLEQPSSSGQKYDRVYDAQQSDGTKLEAAATATSTSQIQSALQELQSESASLDSQFDAVRLTTCGSKSS